MYEQVVQPLKDRDSPPQQLENKYRNKSSMLSNLLYSAHFFSCFQLDCCHGALAGLFCVFVYLFFFSIENWIQ